MGKQIDFNFCIMLIDHLFNFVVNLDLSCESFSSARTIKCDKQIVLGSMETMAKTFSTNSSENIMALIGDSSRNHSDCSKICMSSSYGTHAF